MNIIYFAHNGVEHATPAEAAAHQDSTNWPVLIGVTIIVLLAVAVVIKLLSASEKEAKKDKKDKES
jgi:hypothetical protein